MSHQIRVITQSVGDETASMAPLLGQFTAFAPDVVAVQRATGAQVEELAAGLPEGWSCTKVVTSGTQHILLATKHPFVTGPQPGFLQQPPIVVRDLGYAFSAAEGYYVVHAFVDLPDGTRARIATANLRSGGAADEVKARQRQSQMLLPELARYHDAGFPVVLAADFAVASTGAVPKRFYSAAGGDFHECDQRDPKATNGIGGEATRPSGVKMDYIFVSADQTTTSSLSGGVVATPGTAGNILRGYATVQQTAPLYPY